jgi:DNA topoisomerase-1
MRGSAAIRVSRRRLFTLHTDSKKYAEAVNLVFVSDTMSGIQRKKHGKGFTYIYKNETVKDKSILERIKSLVIPPAWENVWISSVENGHLQVTGIDVRGRKQYKYHPLWEQLRNETKFHRMLEFGKILPAIRRRVENDLRPSEMTQKKVIATVIKLMEQTFIRIGNQNYEKEYGSYGLTTLKNRHIKINRHSIRFSFIGKKGVAHSVTLKSKRMARIVKQCMEIPGQELFQYIDINGERHSIGSGDVNNYIKAITENDMSSKDFRTWAGSLIALQAFREAGEFDSATAAKKKIVEVLDFVSKRLGNTRSVCRKYYVHPILISLYESNRLNKYFEKKENGMEGLSDDENILMRILEAELKGSPSIAP